MNNGYYHLSGLSCQNIGDCSLCEVPDNNFPNKIEKTNPMEKSKSLNEVLEKLKKYLLLNKSHVS